MNRVYNFSMKLGMLAIAALTLILALYFLGILRPSRASARDRVADARRARDRIVRQRVESAGLSYPPARVFIRHFKLEKELEVWGSEGQDMPFKKIVTYGVCAYSGTLGPKRREGDLQVPEGVYKIDRFNPQSRFHLSLGLDYPNRSDRKFADSQRPGGDIFIHGSCVTIGCIPILDGPIEELYLLSLDSKNRFGNAPVVHVFPCRMDDANCKLRLADMSKDDPELSEFWSNLETVYSAFEKNQTLPEIEIKEDGRYSLK